MTYEPPESEILYLVDLNKSGISGYKDLEKPPMTPGAEVEIGASVASSDGEVLIEEFASPAIGLSSIDPGQFEFYLYGSVSQPDGVSKIKGKLFSRTYSGTETELFSFESAEIESSSDEPQLLDILYSSSDTISLSITDRFILKIYGVTDYGSAISVNLHYQGTITQSRIFLPVRLPRITGGDMVSALYDPDQDGYTSQSSDTAGGGGHIIQDEGTPLTARSNLNFAYGFTVTDDELNDTTKVDVTGASTAVDPWISSTDTWALSSSDDPVFVVTVDADVTGIIGVGYKVRFTQDAVTKYGIVHAVGAYSGGYTPLTIYCGTDYDVSANAITNSYYSYARAPLGFPMDPAKWTVESKSTSDFGKTTPTQNVWYNAQSISIPIGSWRIYYQALITLADSSASLYRVSITLSTGNNSQSDVDFTGSVALNSGRIEHNITREKNILLSTKTVYYLNILAGNTGVDGIYILGSVVPIIIRAVDVYL